MAKIIFENVSIGYSNKSNIIKNLNLSINKGDFISIIGPNGSGKSTLILSIFSITKINSGRILYENKDIKNYSKKEIAKKIAFVPQMISFPDDVTLWEFVEFGRQPYSNILMFNKKEDKKEIEKAIKQVDLFEYRNKYISELSGGQKQKALIALALAQNTETIILDEPTNHLDIKAQLEVMHLLHELNHKLNKTIIVVIHDINHGLKFSDNIVILKNGELKLNGKTNDIINEKSIKENFGVIPKIIKSHKQKIIYDYWIENLIDLDEYHDKNKKNE